MSGRTWATFGIAGSLLAGGLIATILTYGRSRGWKEAEARVIENSVHAFKTNAGPQYRPSAQFRYVPDLVTPYFVRYSFAQAFGTEQDARDFINRYAPGSVHRVVFDPGNPFRIALDGSDLEGNLRWPLATLGAGMLFSAIALSQAFRANRALCPKCAESVALWHKFCWSCAAKLPRRRKRVHKLLS